MEPMFLTVDEVAQALNCSTRHVYRLADGGKMPAPVELGALNRWPKATLEEWIAGGCKAVRPVVARRARGPVLATAV